MNPVWKRELRARWRGWRAFGLVFFVVAVLAGIFIWQYHENTRYLSQAEYSDPRQRLSLLGHNLFALLAWLQIILWMLLAPVLTATAITGEREKGLLESLQLSRLAASQIVFGKLLSALSLIALLIVVTLPITATCFLMGGVSPGEFLLVLVLHIVAATCFAAIGLAISAWCRNGTTAIAISIAAMGVWSGLAFLCAVAAFGGLSRTSKTPAWSWNQVFELFAKAHPLTASIELAGVLSGPGAIPWTTSTPSWAASLIFLLTLTAFCLFIAARGTKRISTMLFRLEWQMLQRQLHAVDATNLDTKKLTTQKEKPKDKRWELGVLARMQFSNPILGREVRACFRPRSTSIAMLLIAALLLPLAAFAYAQGFYWVLFDARMREVIGPSLLVIYLLVTIVLCSILGAGGLAREREGATWEALRLSLLSPREILWGKMGAPLLMCAVCGIVFLPVLLPCVRALEYSGADLGGISLTQLFAALAILTATAWACTSISLTFSHFSKRSVTAICWTLGTLFVLLLVLPMFLNQLGSYQQQRAFEDAMISWHPVMAMVNLFSPEARNVAGANDESARNYNVIRDALPCFFLWLGIGTILQFGLLRSLYSSRHADQN